MQLLAHLYMLMFERSETRFAVVQYTKKIEIPVELFIDSVMDYVERN